MQLKRVNGKTRHSNIVRSINTIFFSTNRYVYVVLGYTISSNHTFYFDCANSRLVCPLNPTLHGGGAYMPPRTFFMPGECVHFDEWTILRMTIWQILSSYGKNTEKLFLRLFGVSRGVIFGRKCIFSCFGENYLFYKSSNNHPTESIFSPK